MRNILFLIFLAGCPLSATHSSTTPSANTVETGPSESSSDEKHDRFLPEDFKALLGLTVEQATAKAKQLGHTGTVQLAETRRFVEGCKPDTVCAAEGPMGDTMSFSDVLILSLNPKITIAAPPD